MAERIIDVEVKDTTTPEIDEKPTEPEKTPVEEPKKATKNDELRPDNPLILRKPILINGKERKELTWDEDISTDQFLEADSLTHTGRTSVSVAEIDTGFHFWLGAEMVIAANPEIDPKDFEQLKGRDIAALMRVGRFFMQIDLED